VIFEPRHGLLLARRAGAQDADIGWQWSPAGDEWAADHDQMVSADGSPGLQKGVGAVGIQGLGALDDATL